MLKGRRTFCKKRVKDLPKLRLKYCMVIIYNYHGKIAVKIIFFETSDIISHRFVYRVYYRDKRKYRQNYKIKKKT